MSKLVKPTNLKDKELTMEAINIVKPDGQELYKGVFNVYIDEESRSAIAVSSKHDRDYLELGFYFTKTPDELTEQEQKTVLDYILPSYNEDDKVCFEDLFLHGEYITQTSKLNLRQVSRELKAQRLASVSSCDSRESTEDEYKELYQYYIGFTDEKLDKVYNGCHVEIYADDITDSRYEIKFEQLYYQFDTEYVSEELGSAFYHHQYHGVDACLRGEIFLGEIDLGECCVSPTIKYKKNLVTGEYDFSETKKECIGRDNFTSQAVSISFDDKAIRPLFDLMLDTFQNSDDTLKDQYEIYLRMKKNREEELKHLDGNLSDDILNRSSRHTKP